MQYGSLQRWILSVCFFAQSPRVSRSVFSVYYDNEATAKRHNQERIITRALERLIDQGMLMGYGVRTPHKWFIREVRLTPMGKRHARALSDRRQRLPLKIKTKSR